MDEIELHGKTKEAFKRAERLQKWVAEFLDLCGLPTEAPDAEIRQFPSTEHSDTDPGDIWVGTFLIDVKETFVRFTYPGDFKYPAPMIDSVSNFDWKCSIGKRPNIYVVVSGVLGTMMWLSVKESESHWIKQTKYNTKKQKMEAYYLAEKRWWHPIDELVETLKGELKIN